MTESGLVPEDLEAIAAFIDRRMPADERQAFLSRLDREEALYEVFVETLRAHEESGVGELAEIVEHRRPEPSAFAPDGRSAGRPWAAPVAVAALLALALTPVLVSRLAETPYGETLVAGGRLDGTLNEDWHVQPWSTMRGGAVSRAQRDAAFRVGVRVVDLEVALRADRRDDALMMAYSVARELRGIEFSSPQQVGYEELAEELEADRAIPPLIRRAASLESEVENLFGDDLGPAYELGRWCEAGKLASRSANGDLLGSRSFRRTQRRLAREDWDEETRSHLERIGVLLEAAADRLDLAAIESGFEAIIREV